MKKLKHTLTLAMILLVAYSFGQRTTSTYLDLKISMACTNFYYGAQNSAVADYKEDVGGLQAGFSFQAGITPAFSLVPELYYMRQGGKLKAGNPLTDAETTIRLNTIELPVLGRLHLGKFYLKAGPSVSYAFSGKMTEGGNSGKVSFNQSSNGFNHFGAGIQAGGGFEIPVKEKRLAIEIRYNHGLTNISRGSEMYSRGLTISVFMSKAWKTNPLAKN